MFSIILAVLFSGLLLAGTRTADRNDHTGLAELYINITNVRPSITACHAEHIMVRTTPSLSYQVVVVPPHQGNGQQPNELQHQVVLVLDCCSTVLVSVLAPFCFPRRALSLPLLLLVVLVLHVPRLGLGGGGDDEEQEGGGDEHEEGGGQKARHLTLPQLDDS